MITSTVTPTSTAAVVIPASSRGGSLTVVASAAGVYIGGAQVSTGNGFPVPTVPVTVRVDADARVWAVGDGTATLSFWFAPGDFQP